MCCGSVFRGNDPFSSKTRSDNEGMSNTICRVGCLFKQTGPQNWNGGSYLVGGWVIFLAVFSRSLGSKSRAAVPSYTHCKPRDFYQDLVFRPANQDIGRLPKRTGSSDVPPHREMKG